MQVPKCLQRAATRQLIPSTSRNLVDTGGLDRYKTIRKFFKRELHATTGNGIGNVLRSTDVGRTTVKGGVLGLHVTSAGVRIQTHMKIRLYHASSRIADEKHEGSKGGTNPVESRDSTPHPASTSEKPIPTKPDEPGRYAHLDNYSRFFRRLAMSLPPMQRPTRDDLLKVATGFWQRLRIRFKWFTIKSFRKFNADDISAFITWFLMSQTVWIFVGT